MKINKKKISELPLAESMDGFMTLGVGPDGRSSKANLGVVEEMISTVGLVGPALECRLREAPDENGADEPREWTPNPEWFDIRGIIDGHIKNSSRHKGGYIQLIYSDDAATVITRQSDWLVMTSDDAIYSGEATSLTHTWSTSKDKPLNDGGRRGTRWIMYLFPERVMNVEGLTKLLDPLCVYAVFRCKMPNAGSGVIGGLLSEYSILQALDWEKDMFEDCKYLNNLFLLCYALCSIPQIYAPVCASISHLLNSRESANSQRTAYRIKLDIVLAQKCSMHSMCMWNRHIGSISISSPSGEMFQPGGEAGTSEENHPYYIAYFLYAARVRKLSPMDLSLLVGSNGPEQIIGGNRLFAHLTGVRDFRLKLPRANTNVAGMTDSASRESLVYLFDNIVYNDSGTVLTIALGVQNALNFTEEELALFSVKTGYTITA